MVVAVHVVAARMSEAVGTGKGKGAPMAAVEEEKFAAAVAQAVKTPPHVAVGVGGRAGVAVDGETSGAAKRAAVKAGEEDGKLLPKRKGEAVAETVRLPDGAVVAGVPVVQAAVQAVVTPTKDSGDGRGAPAAKVAGVEAESGADLAPVAVAGPETAAAIVAPMAAAVREMAGPSRGGGAAGGLPAAVAPAGGNGAGIEVVADKAPVVGARLTRQARLDEAIRAAPPAAAAVRVAAAVVTSIPRESAPEPARVGGWGGEAAGEAAGLAVGDGASLATGAAAPGAGVAGVGSGPVVAVEHGALAAAVAGPAVVAGGETAKMAAGLAAAVTAMTREGKNALSIKLDPPSLGNLSIHLAVGDDAKVNVLLVAAVPQTAQAFAAGADELRQALVHSGIDLGQLNVGGGKADAGSGSGSGSGAFAGGGRDRLAPAPDAVRGDAAHASADGVRAIA